MAYPPLSPKNPKESGLQSSTPCTLKGPADTIGFARPPTPQGAQGQKIGPKSGPDFWKTGPERDLGPDAPVKRPNGAMATQNRPNSIFGKPNLGICWTYFAQFAGNRGIMGPNGEAKKMRAEK